MTTPDDPVRGAPDDGSSRDPSGMRWIVESSSSGDLEPRAEPRLSRGASADLVQAFRLNAEALHRLEALQADLARTVQRNDRGELMLQSTQALNDTFRNLASIQRALLERLDAPRRRSRLVPLGVLGLLFVLVGGVVALVEAIRRNGELGRIDANEIAREVRGSFLAGHEEGRAARAADLVRMEADLDSARERAQKTAELLDRKLDEMAELERARRVLESDNALLSERALRGAEAAVAKELLAQELERLDRQRLAHDTVVARLEQEIASLRATNVGLRQRIGDAAIGIPPEAGHEPTGPVPGVPNVMLPGPNEEAAAPSSTDAIADLAPFAAPDLGPLPDEARDPVPASPVATTERDHPRSVPPEPARAAPATPIRPAPSAAVVDPATMPPPEVRRRDGGGDTLVPATPRRELEAELDAILPAMPPIPPAGVVDLASPAPEAAPAEANGRASSVAPPRLRRDVNALLQRARGPGRGWYQATGLDRLSDRSVEGLTLVRFDPNDRTADLFRARDARVVVDRRANEVAVVLRDGIRHNERDGTVPLPPQGLKIVVARVPELVEAWAASGWSFVETR